MELLKFLIKKICILIFSLFLVATFTFLLLKNIPGDPFSQEQAVPEEIMKSMHAYYGLDKPWYIQYFRYLKGIVLWDLGPSFKYEGRNVNEIIAEGAPISFVLGIEALIIAVMCGITLGTIAAFRRSSYPDHLCMILAVIGISIPNFILATFLQYLFSMKLGLLPVARWGSFAQSILPSLSLSALPMAFIARLTRGNMVEVLQQDYVITARSKGLCLKKILFSHVLKNSLITVVTYLAPLCSGILTGSFVIEKIFGIPGLGGWFVTSITNRDYTVIMGVTMFYSTVLMTSVLIVDLIYYFLDPRINIVPTRTSHG
jgi:oligopeptide transport system permease protein